MSGRSSTGHLPGETLVRLAALALPDSHRDEWIAEWLAELEWAWRGDPNARRSARRCVPSPLAVPRRDRRRRDAPPPDPARRRCPIAHDSERRAVRRAIAATDADVHRRRRGDARALHRRDDRGVQHRRVGVAERARLPADRSTRRRVVGQSAGEQRPLSGLRRRLLRLAGAHSLVRAARRLFPVVEHALLRTRRRGANRRRRGVGEFPADARRVADDRSRFRGRRRPPRCRRHRDPVARVLVTRASGGSADRRTNAHVRREAVRRDRGDGLALRLSGVQGRRAAAALRARHVHRPPRSAHALGRRPAPRRRLAGCGSARSGTDRGAAQTGARQGRRRTRDHRPSAARRSRRQRATPDSHSLRRRVRRAPHRLRQRHESHVRARVESPPGVGRPNGDGRAARRDRAAVARRERGHRARVRAGGSGPRRRRDSRAVQPAAVVDRPSRPRRSRRAGARLHAGRERGGDARVRHGAGVRRGRAARCAGRWAIRLACRRGAALAGCTAASSSANWCSRSC